MAAAKDVVGSLHLEKLKIILYIVCFISLLLFSIAGWFYSGRALKPISNVVKKVEDISITSLNLRVFEGNGNDEIGRLAQAFNEMVSDLDAQRAEIESQKERLAVTLQIYSGRSRRHRYPGEPGPDERCCREADGLVAG